ncbi:type I-C CRISPR-associated protein Cas8c/Csd1 [Schinkia azotoformans]|uniref:type I-C CRISPR-associated protein Cas8c/Csd1 n=1 Tax=Schinkia azotoformans TaxID=1454 RepID=UPI002DBB9B67|nr:type I-C CRISPR-associated protein Cas8c/Csd1 [Schinkia azotoformans]MEC1718659.1 type I-C CRISPR-associated protein Cas8c/Csd1 [Schinkia azotoformans]MEC1743777.1 type I-C CRISPR-associated protein Cas8c/Csd1 [Schinkia azotoformans]MEC1746515.1 type I-C CRISPR-associated protein Cas8c/Csd1 [Schinkia azotoformans]MEC1769469.1 type I-C CRISPR-associated protein Cas8c/Csd1 [Schinkia azotoformans]MEC1789664.1 type I-C CRISPR-associated protein Cas8c/Csd1 [Schinkia azotoformans]
MYMRRLVEFAEQHANDLPPVGYARKSYQWFVVITHDDRFEFIQAERGEQRVIPNRSRASGVSPILLTDKAEYVFELPKDPGNAKRAAEYHLAYMKLLKECCEATRNEVVQKIVQILERKNWQIPDGMKSTDVVLFRTEAGDFPHEDNKVKKFWEDFLLNNSSKEENNSICFICGCSAPAVKRHTIEFSLRKERTKLISANESAYFSYGMENSEIAPTCFECEQKYGQALSYLLRKYANKKQLGGPHMMEISNVTYVYWTRQNDPETTSMFTFLSDPDPDAVQRILSSPFKRAENHDSLDRVCILALSANKARMVVRDYAEPPVWKVKNQIRQFFDAQQVVGAPKPASIYLLAACMYRDGRKEMQKEDVQDWMNWALYGKRLSGRIITKIVKRIQARGGMTWIQAAAIKSWLISQKKEEWTVDLDQARITPPYLCGRLFAVLEAVQYEAVKGNETIASRFYAAASTTPRTIFGLLIRNSKWHLSKISKENKGYEVRYQQRIQLITGQLKEFPAVLDLQGQAEFALGYYHERQDIYKKKENMPADSANVSDLNKTVVEGE